MPAKERASILGSVPRFSTKRLEEMLDEATVDCYNEDEQVTGILTMLEEHFDLPFTTTVLGVVVTVSRVELTDSGTIVAVCFRGRQRQRVPVLDLPLPTPKPTGAEWIDAYRRWAKGK